jgi:hypothetical protein
MNTETKIQPVPNVPHESLETVCCLFVKKKNTGFSTDHCHLAEVEGANVNNRQVVDVPYLEQLFPELPNSYPKQRY